MDALKPATKTYIAALLLLSFGLSAVAASRTRTLTGWDAIATVIATGANALAWSFPIPFVSRTKLYVDTAVMIAAVLLLPAPYAALAVGVGALIGNGLSSNRDWPQALFNAAQATLVALFAALLLTLAGWHASVPSFNSPWPLVVLPVVALGTFLLNLLLIAIVTALEDGDSLMRVLQSTPHEDLPIEALAHASLVATGTLIALVAVAAPWGVVLLAIPIVAIYSALHQQVRLRREAEQAHLMSEAGLAKAQRLARLGSWEWHPEANRWAWSDEAYRLFGMAPRSIFPTDRDLTAAVHPADRERVVQALQEARQRRQPFVIEHRILLDDGTVRHVQQRGELSANGTGPPIVLGTIQDITERVEAEASVREAAQAAQAADRAKSQLLTMASHDLRTPLTAIQGYIEMISNGSAGQINDEQRELLAVAHRNTLELSGLISDLLDLARIEAGGLQLRIQATDVNQVLGAVLSTLAPSAAQKGITLKSTAATTPVMVSADAARLKQILLNLVGNAVKFTDRGGVTVHARRVENSVLIDVADTGIGITAEALPHIFEEFSQGGEEARRKGGAGLGLAIVKQLVELHGGSIGVQSTPDIGSTFTVRLPVTSRTAEFSR